MPRPSELGFDPITADWTYIRWLGDRKAIEAQTATWGKTIVDRTNELRSWVDYCEQIRKRGVRIYEVPVSYTGREFDEGKKLTWRDGVAAFWTLVKCRITD